MFPVTKPTLPDLGRYMRYIGGVHERGWLTNFGPLHQELTDRLKAHLGVDHLLLVSNGTIALQVAYRALSIEGRVLTTPFSFIATTSSLAWEGLQPVFADIDPLSLNIDPDALEAAGDASAIVAVHVYGNPCDVDRIELLANRRGIPVIYDAAHAFASKIAGETVLRRGDAATLSFHATKLFHTIEGGAIVFGDASACERGRALINFGQGADGSVTAVGTNAKMSEYHAAAGLVILDSIDRILETRVTLVETYRRALDGWVDFQQWHAQGSNAGAYMPILLADEAQCLALHSRLGEQGIHTRRYFYPSLNTLDLGPDRVSCPVSENVAGRVLCLPLYTELSIADAQHIAERVKAALR